jgi:hypothetical protein
MSKGLPSRKTGRKWGIPPTVEDAREAVRLASVQFEAMGRFIYMFSQLTFSIKWALSNRLGLRGEYFDIVIGPYDFVTLCNVTEKAALLTHSHRETAIKKLFKEIKALNDKRVLVAHAMWVDDFDGLSAIHFKRNSLSSETYSFKNDELDRFYRKAEELNVRVVAIQAAVSN